MAKTANRSKDIIPLLGLHDTEGQLFENIDEIGDDLVVTSSRVGAKALDVQADSDNKISKGPNLWLTRTNSNPEKGGKGGAIWWQTNNVIEGIIKSKNELTEMDFFIINYI